ncbi:hypothetical protein GOP47_0002972 [Adiantum capillus-veneris]|uniref:PH domain-containing protein n=1 Tax=Adiantum capillus-veneris TaxID=13818 RepID=A0A9D4ZPN3_ADICA|nr:hypothetical protein GOP47_0002972 [Adiantum capillus-veneris]
MHQLFIDDAGLSIAPKQERSTARARALYKSRRTDISCTSVLQRSQGPPSKLASSSAAPSIFHHRSGHHCRLLKVLLPAWHSIFQQLDVAYSMLNSLLFEDYMDKQAELESSQTSDDHDLKTFSTNFGRAGAVHCWSVDDVVFWLQKNVPFGCERLKECSRSFQSEGIDGLRLLALQRNSPACSELTDSEWLLLYSARESLLASDGMCTVPCESHQSSPFSSPRSTREDNSEDASVSYYKPVRLHNSKSLVLRPSQKSGLVKSSLKFLSLSSKHLWSSTSTKHEQKKPTALEVSSLHEEILTAEEREAALKAKVDHLDEILRTAQLASYLYTRMRWTPLPGELPVEDVDVDDWLQRFLVLEGSTIFFYPKAADLRPQGAILFSEIVDVGAITGQIQHDQDSITWFGFHITTYEGLRLECATPLKLQAELWMSLLQAACMDQHVDEAKIAEPERQNA